MACPTIRRRTSCPTTTVARARVYVAGWIKRGPRGVIGSNRACAEETVAQLWDDYADGKPNRQAKDRNDLSALLAECGADLVGWSGWQTIDAAERTRGIGASRPRVKFVSVDDLVATAKTWTFATGECQRRNAKAPSRHAATGRRCAETGLPQGLQHQKLVEDELY
jgi:hypothetical protein